MPTTQPDGALITPLHPSDYPTAPPPGTSPAATTEFVTVADEAEMLALTEDDVQAGDWALRADTGARWTYKGGGHDDLDNWVEITSPVIDGGTA